MVKVAMFTQFNCSRPKGAFGGGLARKYVFSKPFKVHQFKKEP